MRNAERNFFSCCSLDVCKVYENTLRRFGAKINFVLAVFRNTLECFKHKIELTNIGKVCFAAVRARNFVLFDIVAHLLICPAGNICAVKIFDEVICSVACFTLTAVHKRVGKSAKVTRCNPSLRIHKNCRVKPYIIFIFLDEFFSPSRFDVCFEFNTERTVVPSVCKTAVNFASRIYKASAFAKGNDLVK